MSDFNIFGRKKSTKKKKRNTVGLEKQKKRAQLSHNREVGIGVQRIHEVGYALAGWNVQRKKTGCDFEASTGKKRLTVESKSSKTAPLRPKQKAMQKKKGNKYRVERGLLD